MDQTYVTNLDYTLKELQRKVREHELKLQELQAANHSVPQSPVDQARVITAALEDVTKSEPFLPFPGSVLPALLALRKTHQTIAESKELLASQAEPVESTKRRLDADKASLRDHRLLRDALAARVESLQAEVNSTAETPPEDSIKKRADELESKATAYNKETSKLMKALNRFINDHLAAMLAAEELGGPVVGEMMDIDTDDLAAGFNAQGKLKKAKEDPNHDKRQRRLDEIWGAAAGGSSTAQGGEPDEVAAAATEMRQLTEELLNRLVAAKGSNAESYVGLPRESAAARFLIRSKVAQFHPKDATRIRLIDFGRELEE